MVGGGVLIGGDDTSLPLPADDVLFPVAILSSTGLVGPFLVSTLAGESVEPSLFTCDKLSFSKVPELRLVSIPPLSLSLDFSDVEGRETFSNVSVMDTSLPVLPSGETVLCFGVWLEIFWSSFGPGLSPIFRASSSPVALVSGSLCTGIFSSD